MPSRASAAETTAALTNCGRAPTTVTTRSAIALLCTASAGSLQIVLMQGLASTAALRWRHPTWATGAGLAPPPSSSLRPSAASPGHALRCNSGVVDHHGRLQTGVDVDNEALRTGREVQIRERAYVV